MILRILGFFSFSFSRTNTSSLGSQPTSQWLHKTHSPPAWQITRFPKQLGNSVSWLLISRDLAKFKIFYQPWFPSNKGSHFPSSTLFWGEVVSLWFDQMICFNFGRKTQKHTSFSFEGRKMEVIFPHCIVFGLSLNLNLLFVCTPENEHGTGKKNRKGVAPSKPPLLDSHCFSIYFNFPGGY